MPEKKRQELLMPLPIGFLMIATFWIISKVLSTVIIFIPAAIVSYLFTSSSRENIHPILKDFIALSYCARSAIPPFYRRIPDEI